MRTRGKAVIAATALLAAVYGGGAAYAQQAPPAPGQSGGRPQTTPPGQPGQTEKPATTSGQQNSQTNPGLEPGQPDSRNGALSSGNRQQVPDSPDFDMRRTIGAALSSSTDLVNATRRVEIDRRRANEAASAGRPTITGSASATRYDQATQLQVGPDSPPVTVLEDHFEQLSLGITQRLDFTGQIRAATNQARLQSLADRFTVDQIRNARVLDAKTRYYSLLRAQHQVQVAESALRAAQAQRDIAKRLYEGQVGQKIDLLRAETTVAQAEQDRERAVNDASVARASFNDLAGRPLDAPVNLKDVPGVTVGTDVTTGNVATPPAGTPPAEPFTPFTAPVDELQTVDVAAQIDQAQKIRPSVLRAEAEARATEVGVKLARAGQEPSFSVSASGNYYPTTSFQSPRQRTAGITAAISIPLWDGGATRERVAQARLETENAKALLESSKSDVALEVRQAYLNMLTAARQITAANAAREQAVAARQLAQVRYEGQVGLFLEVTDAQAALVRAENNQVDAVYAYLVARARYEEALGAPTQE